MGSATSVQPTSFDRFRTLLRSDHKADLLKGAVHMASPEHLDIHATYQRLYVLLSLSAQQKQQGVVVGSRVTLRIDEVNVPEPDIAFVAKAHGARLRPGGYIAGPPDLAIEIVSRSSLEHDYVLVRRLYERAGVQEYWIADPLRRRVTLLRRNKTRIPLGASPGRRFAQPGPSGFGLRPDWLWQANQPGILETLGQLLG